MDVNFNHDIISSIRIIAELYCIINAILPIFFRYNGDSLKPLTFSCCADVGYSFFILNSVKLGTVNTATKNCIYTVYVKQECETRSSP